MNRELIAGLLSGAGFLFILQFVLNGRKRRAAGFLLSISVLACGIAVLAASRRLHILGNGTADANGPALLLWNIGIMFPCLMAVPFALYPGAWEEEPRIARGVTGIGLIAMLTGLLLSYR